MRGLGDGGEEHDQRARPRDPRRHGPVAAHPGGGAGARAAAARRRRHRALPAPRPPRRARARRPGRGGTHAAGLVIEVAAYACSLLEMPR